MGGAAGREGVHGEAVDRDPRDRPPTPSIPLPPLGGRGTPPPARLLLNSSWCRAGGTSVSWVERPGGRASTGRPSTAIHEIAPQLPRSLSPRSGGEGRHLPPVFSSIPRGAGRGGRAFRGWSGREGGRQGAPAAASATAVEQPSRSDADADEAGVCPPALKFSRRPLRALPPGRSRQTPRSGRSRQTPPTLPLPYTSAVSSSIPVAPLGRLP